MESQQIEAGDRPGARTDPQADEAPTQGPSFTRPITRARTRMMAEAGQTRDSPLPLDQLITNLNSPTPLLILLNSYPDIFYYH